MVWQYILILFLLGMCAEECIKQSIFCALKGESKSDLRNIRVGIVLRYIFIFAILFYGGFFQST